MQTKTIDDLILQRSRFLQFLKNRVDSSSTAEDILQSAYIRALEKSSTLHNDESSVAWFYRILRNAVIDHYRHRAAEDRALEQWAKDLITETQPDESIHNIVCQCVESVLSTLKPQYGEIIRSVDLSENTLESFANAAGITPGNAAVRIHRARQALRKQLALTCGTCAKLRCVDCTCS
ncbi:MAG: sigma-70 family RNA polymerase sigma factor [Edaphobacter sp.]